MDSNDIGALTELGSLQERVPGTDAWVEVAPELFARVVAVGGEETLQAGQLQASPRYAVTIWGRPGVREDMRFVWDSRFGVKTLQLLAVRPVDEWLVLECVEAHA